MFEQFDDVLTVAECCDALRMGYNAVYELLNSGSSKHTRTAGSGSSARRP